MTANAISSIPSDASPDTTPAPTEYVLGFLFSPDLSSVVLIKKNRPSWQAGKLNGVGGKYEASDELLSLAMHREFSAETGVMLPRGDWRAFGQLDGRLAAKPEEEFVVYLYAAQSERINEVETMTDEQVIILPVPTVTGMTLSVPTFGSTSALVLLAREFLQRRSAESCGLDYVKLRYAA